MASTKVVTAIWSGQTLTAGAGDTTSSAVTVDAGYGGSIHLKITNGATGPTVAAQIIIQVSGDNSEWYDKGGAYIGGTANDGVYSTGDIPFGIGVEYIRCVAGSNTGQDVTVDVDLTEVTAV